MKARATSLAAYRAMVASGALLGKQAQVLEAVIEHGPATSGEIIEAGKLGHNKNLVRARFTELVNRGLIRETGQRVCKITGRTGLVWEYTGRTKPLKLERGHRITDAVRKRVRSALTATSHTMRIAAELTLTDDDLDAVIRAARA